MAGTMRKMAVYLGLVEDQDRYDEYEAYDEPTDATEERRPSRAVTTVREDAVVTANGSHRLNPRSLSTAEPRATSEPRSMSPSELSRITTLHPRTYNEARTIGENFRDGTPVIMNLTEMDDSDAKRLVDFAAGLIFGLHGSIERVTQKVFLLSPANVTVTAEDKARIAEGGFFNQS